MQATLQGAVRLPAALCDTDGGSCHFHSTVTAALCDAGGCFFIKCCLFTDLCQTRIGRRYDKTNVEW